MKKLTNIVSKLGKPVAAIALFMGVLTMHTACFGWFHQPKVPEAMNKFRR